MNERSAIIMDLDNVAYPFQAAWHLAAAAYGVVNWQDAELYPRRWKFYEEFGMTTEEFAETLVEWTPAGLYSTLHPDPQVASAWRLLAQREDVDIHVITARPAEATDYTIDWMNNNGLRWTTLHVVGHVNKAHHLPVGYQRIYAIDDSPTQIKNYWDAAGQRSADGTRLIPVRFVQHWNMDVAQLPAPMISVHSGSELAWALVADLDLTLWSDRT